MVQAFKAVSQEGAAGMSSVSTCRIDDFILDVLWFIKLWNTWASTTWRIVSSVSGLFLCDFQCVKCSVVWISVAQVLGVIV